MAFATAVDIATRRGRTFTAAETAMAALLCDAATAVIADAADKDDAWAAALAPVPQILHFVAVELVARVMPNPDGLAAYREALGAYQHSENFRDVAAGGGLLLSRTEELLVRRAVHGTTTGSAAVQSSQVEEQHDLIWGS